MAEPVEGQLARRIVQRLERGPALFHDILVECQDAEYRDILRAWSDIRQRIALGRDQEGHYLLPGDESR